MDSGNPEARLIDGLREGDIVLMSDDGAYASGRAA